MAAPAANFPPFTEQMIVPTLTAGFFTIYPSVANAILERRNSLNRTLKPIKIRQLVNDIEAGKFCLNGESVIFSASGVLLDGQHRLEACRQTGSAVSSLIATGLPEEAALTLDQGVARTTGDILQMAGTEYGNNVASIGRLAFAWLRGDGRSIGALNNVSRADILELVEADPTIADAASYGQNNRMTGLANATVVGFCYWIIGRQYGADVAEEYLSKVITGENLLLGEGALAVRNRLMATGKAPNTHKVEIVLRGFVAHYQGAKISRIQVSKALPPLPLRKAMKAA
jgi:hypothetical protein